MNNLPIEIHFPFSDLDIVKLLKGTEFNKIHYINHDMSINIKIYCSDKVKCISFDNWNRIYSLSYDNHMLRDLLRYIEHE